VVIVIVSAGAAAAPQNTCDAKLFGIVWRDAFFGYHDWQSMDDRTVVTAHNVHYCVLSSIGECKQRQFIQFLTRVSVSHKPLCMSESLGASHQ
jgi:hypothetical protein